MIDPYHFTKEVYKGVPIYWNQFDWAPCIHVHIGLTVGAIDDPAGKEGLSHFLEHLPFDGSTQFPSIDAVKQISKNLMLDSFNARTSHNSTVYHARMLPVHFKEGLHALGNIVFHPLLTAHDIERERSIIIEEAWGRLRNEKYIKHLKEMLTNGFHDHPLSRSERALGWPDTIASITETDIKEWHAKTYHRGNVIIMIGGAVQPQHLEEIRHLIDAIPAGTRLPDLTPPIDWDKPKETRITRYSEAIGSPQQQASLILYRIRPTAANMSEIENVTNHVLHEILFTELREKRALVYGVHIGKNIDRDLSEYYITANLSNDHVETAEQAIYDELDAIIGGKYTAVFEKEKSLLIERLQAIEFTSGGVLSGAFHDIEYFDSITTLTEEIEQTRQVSYEDMTNFIKETYNPETRGVTILRP